MIYTLLKNPNNICEDSQLWEEFRFLFNEVKLGMFEFPASIFLLRFPIRFSFI